MLTYSVHDYASLLYDCLGCAVRWRCITPPGKLAYLVGSSESVYGQSFVDDLSKDFMKTTTVPLKEEPAASEVVVDRIKFVAKSATTEGGSQRAVRAAKRTRSREHRLANFRRVTVDFALQ